MEMLLTGERGKQALTEGQQDMMVSQLLNTKNWVINIKREERSGDAVPQGDEYNQVDSLLFFLQYSYFPISRHPAPTTASCVLARSSLPKASSTGTLARAICPGRSPPSLGLVQKRARSVHCAQSGSRGRLGPHTWGKSI